MANTTNYNFEKPAQTDYYDVEVQNNNWDKLDTELKKTNDNKQDTLVSGVSIKTINGESLLGSGNIFIKGGTLSEEVTAKRADVLKGKTTIMNDSADEIVEGTLEVQSIVNFNLSLYASETVMGAWQKPAKGPYSGVTIVYRTDRYPNSATDGTVAYEGNGINFTKTLPAGTKHYFAAFSYMNTNIGKIYSDVAAKAEFTPSKIQGRQVFKSNGTFTVPAGVYNIQVFAVGGGGGGGGNERRASTRDASGGGGGGYTKTQSISVTPGQHLNVIIGAGGAGGKQINGECGLNGGTSQIGNVSAGGGAGGINRYVYPNESPHGGAGGSGGGGGSQQTSAQNKPNKGGNGGNNGANGEIGLRYNDYRKQYETYSNGGVGQGITTREFAQSGATLYAGGGGGGGADNADGGAGGSGGGGRGSAGGYSRPNSYPSPGSANTGGGGGGGGGSHSSHGSSGSPGAAGGSGIVIVRWGY